jgi:O-antigen/teichoic acid export membrane protein
MPEETEDKRKQKILMWIGISLLLIGILFFVILAVHIFRHHYMHLNNDNTDQLDASLAALGFLSIMLSLTFIFPELLKGGPNENMSTMRVAVYMIICVFVFLIVKIGWACTSFEGFQISAGWVSIIVAALGGKAIQSVAENNVYAKRAENPTTGPKTDIKTDPKTPTDNTTNKNNRAPQPGASNQPTKS